MVLTLSVFGQILVVNSFATYRTGNCLIASFFSIWIFWTMVLFVSVDMGPRHFLFTKSTTASGLEAPLRRSFAAEFALMRRTILMRVYLAYFL